MHHGINNIKVKRTTLVYLNDYDDDDDDDGDDNDMLFTF